MIDEILNYRTYAKLLSTYVEGLLNADRPRTGGSTRRFIQTEARTGRISSTEPNLQNIPGAHRAGQPACAGYFVARRGRDAAWTPTTRQIELRILAAHQQATSTCSRRF